MRTRSAFTLIELLVVVAIISVLISILLPSLAGARKQARQVLCATNLRSQGQSMWLYAQDNRDYMWRGMNDTFKMNYAIMLLRGLAYDGPTRNLWLPYGQVELIKIVRSIKPFQCPSHPDPRQPLAYVSSAMPIPYTQANANRDQGGGNNGDGWRPENSNGIDYVSWFKAGDTMNYASRLVVATEGHVTLQYNELRFHHFFLTNQLPFGAFPRTANDRRHPGGINGLFFDGSARTVSLKQFDCGWPNSRGLRLRYATLMPKGMN